MSTPEQPTSGWYPQMPFGLKISAGIAMLIAFGTFILTTIDNGFRVSLYAGLGIGVIFFALFLLVWVVARHAKENRW